MDADVAALQRFSDAPYVIEAPAPQAGLANAAATALAKAGVRVSMKGPEGMAPSRYAGMIEQIRRTIEAELAPRRGYAIKVFDASARNESAELAKADPSLRREVGNLHKLVKARAAFSTGFDLKGGGAGCLVVGFKPDFPLSQLIDITTGVPGAPRMGLDDGLVHRMTLLHEVGHCLLGVSEAKADAFAALMLLRDPSFPKEALSFWATWREKLEWSTPELEDDHFTAKAVWSVIERSEALRADPAFATMGVEDMANLASELVDARGQTLPQELEAVASRRAIRAGIAAVEPRAAKGIGFEPLAEWLVRHQDIPEAARLLGLQANLAEGAGAMAPFESEPGSFREALGDLARGGDPVASAMAKAYDATPRPSAGGHQVPTFVAKIPYRYGQTPFTARAVAFDPACDVRLPEMAREEPAPRVAPGRLPLGSERDEAPGNAFELASYR